MIVVRQELHNFIGLLFAIFYAFIMLLDNNGVNPLLNIGGVFCPGLEYKNLAFCHSSIVRHQDVVLMLVVSMSSSISMSSEAPLLIQRIFKFKTCQDTCIRPRGPSNKMGASGIGHTTPFTDLPPCIMFFSSVLVVYIQDIVREGRNLTEPVLPGYSATFTASMEAVLYILVPETPDQITN